MTVYEFMQTICYSIRTTLYHNSSVFVLEFHLRSFQLCLCTVQLEEKEEGGEGGGEVTEKRE